MLGHKTNLYALPLLLAVRSNREGTRRKEHFSPSLKRSADKLRDFLFNVVWPSGGTSSCELPGPSTPSCLSAGMFLGGYPAVRMTFVPISSMFWDVRDGPGLQLWQTSLEPPLNLSGPCFAMISPQVLTSAPGGQLVPAIHCRELQCPPQCR